MGGCRCLLVSVTKCLPSLPPPPQSPCHRSHHPVTAHVTSSPPIPPLPPCHRPYRPAIATTALPPLLSPSYCPYRPITAPTALSPPLPPCHRPYRSITAPTALPPLLHPVTAPIAVTAPTAPTDPSLPSAAVPAEKQTQTLSMTEPRVTAAIVRGQRGHGGARPREVTESHRKSSK